MRSPFYVNTERTVHVDLSVQLKRSNHARFTRRFTVYTKYTDRLPGHSGQRAVVLVT